MRELLTDDACVSFLTDECVPSCATELADGRHGLSAIDFSPTVMVNGECVRLNLFGHKNRNLFRKFVEVDEYPHGGLRGFHVIVNLAVMTPPVTLGDRFQLAAFILFNFNNSMSAFAVVLIVEAVVQQCLALPRCPQQAVARALKFAQFETPVIHFRFECLLSR